MCVCGGGGGGGGRCRRACTISLFYERFDSEENLFTLRRVKKKNFDKVNLIYIISSS